MAYGVWRMRKASEDGLSRLSGLFGLSHSSNPRDRRDQMNRTDEIVSQTVVHLHSLARMGGLAGLHHDLAMTLGA